MKSSFVDVRHLFVDISPRISVFQKLFGKPADPHSVLRDVSFDLDAGEHVVLYGDGGAGKSTLLRTLAGALKPSRGNIRINGKLPNETQGLAAGYVSVEETEPASDTVHAALSAYGTTHSMSSVPARVGSIADNVGLSGVLSKSIMSLSTTQRIRLNLARAAMSNSPIILLDDVVDQLGAAAVKQMLATVFAGRTVVIATRSVEDAQNLGLPIMILHSGTIVHFGTQDVLATAAGCPRTVHAWVESLRYDILRSLRRLPGVMEVRLIPTDQFEGQKLEITVQSSRYLPTLYDHMSQTPLIKIEEHPVSLGEILTALS